MVLHTTTSTKPNTIPKLSAAWAVMFGLVNRHRAASTLVAALVTLLSIPTTNTKSFMEKVATIEAKARTRGMLNVLDDVGRLKDLSAKDDGESFVFENATSVHMNTDATVADANLPSESIKQNHSTSAPVLEDGHNVTVSEPIRPPWAALCAVMRDEDLYVDEWTDYHLALGFEHIFIYESHPNFTLSEWYTERVAQEGDVVPHNMSTAHRVHLTHRVLPDTGNVQELVNGECLDKLRALDDPPK
jgi:hypothetical protein